MQLIAALLIASSAAPADVSITLTATHTACQIPPPVDVLAPVTPTTAAGDAAVTNHNYALARANLKAFADGGSVEGQRHYGALLMLDCTAIQDREEAAAWLLKGSRCR